MDTDTNTGGPRRRLQAGVLAAGAVVALAFAGLGVAGAQTDDNTTTTDPPAGQSQPAPDDGDGRKPGCRHGHHGHHAKASLDVAANTIGISLEELRTAVRGGQSIAQVAQSKGVEPQRVIDAMVADAKERLADAVESGRLTQAQADEKAAALTARITDVVNREGGPRGGPRRPGPRPPRGADGNAPAQPSSITVA